TSSSSAAVSTAPRGETIPIRPFAKSVRTTSQRLRPIAAPGKWPAKTALFAPRCSPSERLQSPGARRQRKPFTTACAPPRNARKLALTTSSGPDRRRRRKKPGRSAERFAAGQTRNWLHRRPEVMCWLCLAPLVLAHRSKPADRFSQTATDRVLIGLPANPYRCSFSVFQNDRLAACPSTPPQQS